MADVVLQAGRARAVRRRHPWVFSGAVDRVEGGPGPGDWVRVVSGEGEPIGFGHFSPQSSIRVRMLTWGKEEPPDGLIAERIAAAAARRAGSPLLAGAEALRLVNAEADGLPGLVADRYGDAVVVRLGTAGMEARRDEIAAALREVTGASLGYERAASSSARREGFPARQGALWGGELPGTLWICEASRRYALNLADGQQTGFYLIHRDSRDLVQRIAADRRVLDLFSYSGGFSVAAARGGARSATLVESSADALALARRSLEANAPGFEARFEHGDAFATVRRDIGSYDLVVVDPPPLARTRREVARASRAYKDVLRFALKRAAPGALVLAFSSSSHVDADLFRKIAFGASLDADRDVQVLRVLGPAADHPTSIYHPEGASLSGLLLQA